MCHRQVNQRTVPARSRPIRREPELKSFLAHLPLFAGLTRLELERLEAGASRRRLKRGDVLFRQGEAPAGLFAVVHGRIALTAESGPGQERITEVIGPGRSFGEAIMFLERPYIVGARALGDALVLQVSKETVFAELARTPGFARRIIAALAAKLHGTVRELDLYALGSSGQRFAAWLLQNLPPLHAGPSAVVLPVAKRAVASRLNLSPEHLSRILRQLGDAGLVQVQGRKLHIPDPAALRRWSRQPRQKGREP